MICYIVDRIANNFNKTSNFAIIIAITAHISLCVYVLFI